MEEHRLFVYSIKTKTNRRKIMETEGVVLGFVDSPAYWWDTSGLAKYLILKMDKQD